MKIDMRKSVYIKDEGEYASIRQEGLGEIGALNPSKRAINDFKKFLTEKNIPFESEFD